MSTPDAVDPARLERWAERLRSLPAIALPTDYPRPATTQVVTAFTRTRLDRRARNAIARLALYTEEEEHSGAPGEGEDSDEETHEEDAAGPTAFHILLAAFVVLLHRYTGDTDLVIGTSSPVDGSPLIVRVPIEPGDAFWQVVRRIQTAEAEAAADNLPYDVIAKRLEADRAAAGETLSAPLFRVRFLDETSGGAGRDFIQATASTTDLTIFVTGPDAAAPGTEEDTPTPKTSAFGTASSTLRQSILPDIALHLSYNALLFTSARMSFLVNQLLHLVSTASADPTTPVGTISLRTPSEDKILPDPRKDLDWCGFRGSITDIFERNAAHFPNRRCLVESLSTETESGELVPPASRVREVSYGELDAASNVLAHHLLDSGVQREEVVTVYAHRGVDLVVAVLGTLKAGATFSVIDPAYPASRQNIYLQVAKPRALVILAKAGRLAPAVRQYIENELDLRTEVPALELTMDGKIHGGAASEGAGDVLDSSQHKAKQSTGVVLGPDSVGTLSFTSGSTGIPKGVQGRHHSLTHFFPWMGERFNLTSKDRFLMLSGIAHDPIQRDMFTPLFFGAELHIPTAEDIGTPGRLAEWMAATQATVVHLTPAMGQLLTAQATVSIPSLRNAFFVGDVLTKRDCTRLQALAGNVVIINMYGTTETQRAVSYFALPSINEDAAFLRGQKDIMPAGQGMIDVQLLVVNRNNRMVTTGVGEVGEIYVRSGGLAEGYLGPPEMSAEKFVPNFLASDLQWEDTLKGTPEGQFWKGVRDRMYRTGDLGRYLPDGTVECTGRADDQIKIRGFRIELGEIDTHLSRHPHVRENVTLVRRDKNEDKVLVSYFVPGAGAVEYEEELSSAASGDEGTSPRDAALVRAVKKYRNLIKDMREFLKRKLPSYSVPTHFVPMSKMPLNPNGKIDKPALPFPDTALANATALKKSSHRATGVADRQLTPTETTVAQLWSQLLPSVSQPIPTDESFFDLGGHSILATRLVFELRKAFVINIPLGVVFDRPTLASLAQAIDGIRAQDGSLGMTVPGSGSAKDAQGAAGSGEVDYAGDLAPLTAGLPEVYSPAHPARDNLTVLLTGATGFLGSYVLADLLGKRKNVGRVLAHVRAKDPSAGLARLETACTNRGVWDASWVSQGRVEAVVGDLEKEELGVDKAAWERLAKEVDVIIHNGALVRIDNTVDGHVENVLLTRNNNGALCSIRYTGYTLTNACVLRTCSARKPCSSWPEGASLRR